MTGQSFEETVLGQTTVRDALAWRQELSTKFGEPEREIYNEISSLFDQPRSGH